MENRGTKVEVGRPVTSRREMMVVWARVVVVRVLCGQNTKKLARGFFYPQEFANLKVLLK